MTLRPISAAGLTRPIETAEVGPEPVLQWLKVADLVVDDRYQRPIVGAGLQNVRAIARGFLWSKFAPLIVAPAPGGKFAVIDGQHRATAAALRDIVSVPAVVIQANEVEQAAAFRAINGQVTRIHALAVQHAAVAAGDPDAVELNAVCEAAGVKILRYPVAANNMKPGETLALGALSTALRQQGPQVLVLALMCVTETRNNRPGVLAAQIVKALCQLVAENAAWRAAGAALVQAFDDIDLEHELEEARVTRRGKGTAAWEILADRLRTEVARRLGPGT